MLPSGAVLATCPLRSCSLSQTRLNSSTIVKRVMTKATFWYQVARWFSSNSSKPHFSKFVELLLYRCEYSSASTPVRADALLNDAPRERLSLPPTQEPVCLLTAGSIFYCEITHKPKELPTISP